MQAPSTPSNEQARLKELAQYQILDSPEEVEFDGLTALAAQILDVPVVLVTIIDGDRQWFKSHHGLALRETPRDVSFCGHVVADAQPLVVPDAFVDKRFADNPLVTGEPRVRFYAGMPLSTPDGYVLGTLCAIAHQPRELTPQQRLSLDALARQVTSLLELRRRNIEMRSLARELFEEKEKGRITLGAITEAVLTTNSKGMVQYMNPAAEKMTGWSQDEARGIPIERIMAAQPFSAPAGTLSSLGQELSRISTSAASGKKIALLVRRDGSECAIEYGAAPLPDRDGNTTGAVVISHDVGEILALANKMSHLAHHDALTGLPNRLLLQDRTLQAIETARRKKTRFAVLFLDLDKFKDINDSLGHAAADDLLKDIAHRLVGMLRGCDTVCRQGGDEFVLLLQEVTDGQAVARIADKVLRTMSEPFMILDRPLVASFSIGASIFPDDGNDFETLIKHADAAMYRAKTAGRNRYQLYSTRTPTRP
jgi:diguanylate cyclase (GGDEF)-like protein/PAS domain S-box-containing protein